MIYIRLIGGLGNQMFQYALGRHLALKNKTELVADTTHFELIPKNREHFVKREYNLDMFNVPVKILEPMNAKWLPCYSKGYTHKLKNIAIRFLNFYNFIDDYQLVCESKPFSFDNEILKSGMNSYLIGYWQNEGYFKDIEKQIRHDFTFKDTFDEYVHELAKIINDTNSVCINIRRGDFVSNPTHGFVGMGYIFNAINNIKDKVDNIKLYVFSDDIDWCVQNLRFDVPCLFVTHDYAGEKFSSYLYLMTKCRHFIIPNSTFGWWGAWLSENPEKIVIVPKQWVGVPGLDASGIIPEGWITI